MFYVYTTYYQRSRNLSIALNSMKPNELLLEFVLLRDVTQIFAADLMNFGQLIASVSPPALTAQRLHNHFASISWIDHRVNFQVGGSSGSFAPFVHSIE